MKHAMRRWIMGLVGLVLLGDGGWAQTDGAARFQATLLDYNGSGTKHWTVVWVTTQSGAFVKTLWRQGPSLTSSQWNSHCSTWYGQKSGSTAFDGYTSATASNYTGTNSPVVLTWNCRNASNALVPDGGYKFWVQYAEDSGQGPYTTTGLVWTKGTTGSTNTYANQGANFSSMKVSWVPVPPPTPPVIVAVVRNGSSLVWSGTGPTNRTMHTLFSTDPGLATSQWSVIATNVVDAAGNFQVTSTLNPAMPQGFYRLRVP